MLPNEESMRGRTNYLADKTTALDCQNDIQYIQGVNMFIFGWIGGFFGAVYALPQALKSIKYKNSLGISRWFLLFWFMDKVCTLVYVSYLNDYPLMIKYSMGLICVLIIGYFKFFGKYKS